MHRYPENIEVTAEEAIAALLMQEVVLDDAQPSHALWHELSAAARKAEEIEEPNWPVVKALWLIANACSMTMNAESVNEPFGPVAVFEKGRSTALTDFGPADLALFAGVAKDVPNRVLRARLADLAWIGSKPKNVQDARRAIDAYLEQLPNADNWATSLDEWRRSVTLCRQLRQGAEGRLDWIKQELERLAESELQLDEGIGRLLAELLFDCGLGDFKDPKFAELLAARGESLLDKGGEFWSVRTYLDLAARWFARLGNPERVADMTVKIALSFEADADKRIALEPRTGHIVAQSFLEDAIQALRKVPKDQRPSRNVDEQMLRLSLRLSESGQKAIESIPTITAGKIDITQIVESSVNAMSGKKTLPALIQLSHLHSGADLAQMTQIAEESLREFPFSKLFGASHMSRDGRVIAKTSAAGMDDTYEGLDPVVFAKIMEHYAIDINLVCQAQILPGWRTLIQEHTIRNTDMAQLMALSPIVPPGRAQQFAKGLWEGLEGNFITAIYLLAPQIEHLARWHLKKAGAKTTNLDGNGIENEIGLSSLVEMPELTSLFGKNIAFEMRALFCTALGPNLRNEVAHGLLTVEDGESVWTIYAWWWVLRLTLKSFVHSLKTNAPPAPSNVS